MHTKSVYSRVSLMSSMFSLIFSIFYAFYTKRPEITFYGFFFCPKITGSAKRADSGIVNGRQGLVLARTLARRWHKSKREAFPPECLPLLFLSILIFSNRLSVYIFLFFCYNGFLKICFSKFSSRFLCLFEIFIKHNIHGFFLIGIQFDGTISLKAGTCRNQFTDDYVFF